MKALITPLLLALFPQVSAAEAKPLEQLDELRWQNRIILLNNPDNLAQSKQRLESASAGVEDRDVVWFILNDESVDTNYDGELSADFAKHARSQYFRPQDQLVLIGKDGGVKTRAAAMELDGIFSTIDGMPMRRDEMRAAKQ